MPSENSKAQKGLVRLTADIVAAHLRNNAVPTDELHSLIASVHNTLQALSVERALEPHLKPAVPVRRSVHSDYVICLEDGVKLKMLKRYLRSRYGMSPEESRPKWNLPADYPMVAPNYARLRFAFAKKIGLGRKSIGRPRKQRWA